MRSSRSRSGMMYPAKPRNSVPSISGHDIPRSPSSFSSTSRKESYGSVYSDSHYLDPPAPSSPPMRLTRKRAASLNTDPSALSRVENLSINSAVGNGPRDLNDPTREHVCLCQPDPKIPRPRNAFILYRQHYQAQVVAQNPGLANPEISKIIGEQWRDQPLEVKNEWKRLAEEEKHRHQRQYPDYRYQPRRAGKASGNRPQASSSDESGRCTKCNGRYISTPSTPLTPFTPSFGFQPAERTRQPSLLGDQRRPSEAERLKYLDSSTMNSPRAAPVYPPGQRRPVPSYPPGTRLLPPTREQDEDMEMMGPPQDLKRRRINDGSREYNNPQQSYPGPQQRLVRQPDTPIYDGRDRRGPLPGPSALVRQPHGGMMEPPPRPSPAPYSARAGTFDESLRLPPLQTQLTTQIGRLEVSRAGDQAGNRESQARSVEAMVMTIPYINKIKVLAKISPQLAAPGPTSPAQETRGAVIAVEGADAKLVAEVGKFIEEHLSRDRECFVKTWTADPSPSTSTSSSTAPSTSTAAAQNNKDTNTDSKETSEAPESAPETDKSKPKDSEDVEMTSPSAAPIAKTQTPQPPQPQTDPFLPYLTEIQSWHTKSLEIAHHITTKPPSASEVASPRSKRTYPVALLPHGFSLTTSDKYACSVPINDYYAPVDHWQWMATLWRGILGPDLIIFVKSVNTNPGPNTQPPQPSAGIVDSAGNIVQTQQGHGQGQGQQASVGERWKEEMARYGGVEVRNDCRAVVVRVPEDRGNGKEEEGEGGAGCRIEEKTLRRLGFEVLEFVRQIGGSEEGN